MAADTGELDGYGGRKLDCLRDLGEDRALLLLHKRFNGNASQASEWLGFRTPKPVAERWAKLGLESRGREYNNRHEREVRAADGGETVEQTIRRLTNISRTPKMARRVRLHVPDGIDHALLVPIADIHLQNPGCAIDRLLDLVAWIEERPYCYWFAAGDVFELNSKSAVGRTSEQTMSLNQALKVAKHIFSPIAHRCIGIGRGNHDSRLMRDEDVEWNPAEQLAENLGVPFMGYCEHMIIEVGQQSYTTYYHHGVGAARTVGARVNSGMRVVDMVGDELVIVGHLHNEFTMKKYRVEVMKNGKLQEVAQRLVQCPPFLRHGGYAEEKALPPSPIGACSIELRANEHQIRVIE